jgi:hypothetical protein
VSICFNILAAVIWKEQNGIETNSDLVQDPCAQGKDLQKPELNEMSNLQTPSESKIVATVMALALHIADRLRQQSDPSKSEASSLKPNPNHQPDMHVKMLDQP